MTSVQAEINKFKSSPEYAQLSRQERRMVESFIRKGSGKRPMSKDRGVLAFQKTLFRASKQETTEDDINVLVLPIYAEIDKLTRGLLEMDGFVRLNEMTAFGYELASLLYHGGDEQTQDILAPLASVFGLCGDALEEIGERKGRTNKFGASGGQLQKLRDMASNIETLCGVASRGMILQALETAEKQVTQAMKEASK